MRKNLLLFFITALTLTFASCGKKDGGDGGNTGGGGGTGGGDGKPVVRVSKGSILADGFETARISVQDAAGNDVTAQAYITINGGVASGLDFYTTAVGSNSIKAQFNGKESSPVTVTATDPGPSKYSLKALSEDHTGAWCGYCPTEAHSLNSIAGSFPRAMFITVHNGDPMAFPLEAQMRARFGVNAFPTTIVNKKFEWNGSSTAIVNETNKWAPLGLAIESSIAGNTISGKVKTEFNVTTDLPLTVTIMLVENNIVYPQTNYYNNTAGNPFFGQGNPIPGYQHKYVLRKISTDLFGDAIPSASQVKGTTYEKTYSFDATGYNLANCFVYATVGFSSSAPAARKGVLNAQRVKAGDNQALD
jgi:thiol-disulfide isomerase/thioredoxin